MIFDALTIGQLKTKIKDLPDDMPIYLDLDNESECQGLLSIQQRTVTTSDMDGDEAEIESLVLGVA